MEHSCQQTPVAPSEPVPSAGDRADLGILLVHGIGEHAQGETVTEMAEPIIAWVRGWLRTASPSDSHVASKAVSAALRPPLLAQGEPAHARVVFGAHAEAWLFAEAWWTPQVIHPPLGSFVAWLLTCGPWLTLFHFNQRWLSGSTPTWIMVVLGIPISLLWMLLSMFVNVVLIAVYLLALLPIGQLRSVFYRLLRTLSGVVGDAYVKIRNPLQRRAMEDATLQALQWLRPQCKQLAVIAHSQGAAIAHGALQRPDAARAELFVTVGAGMVKLSALRYLQDQAASDRVAALLAPPTLLLAVTVFLRARQLGLTDAVSAWWAPLALGAMGVGLLASTWITVRGAFADLRQSSPRVAFGQHQDTLQWCDIVASHDPVPQGNVTTFFDLPEGKVAGHEVQVLRSTWQDHTHYWSARASFVPLLVRELARCSASSRIRIDSDDARFQQASNRFSHDLLLLSASAWADRAAVVLPLLFARDRIVSIVHDARQVLRGTGSTSSPLGFVDGFLTSAEAWVTLVAGVATPMSQESAHRVVNWLTAAAALTGAYLLWRRVFFAMWQTWSANRNAEVLRARDIRPVDVGGERQATSDRLLASVGPVILNGLFLSLAQLPVVSSVLWTLMPSWLTEPRLFRLAGAVPLGLFIIVMVLGHLGSVADQLGDARTELNRARAEGALLYWPVARDYAYRLLGVVMTVWLPWTMLSLLGVLPDSWAANPSVLGLLSLCAGVVYLLDKSWQLLCAGNARTSLRVVILGLPLAAGAALASTSPARAESVISFVNTVTFVALLSAGLVVLSLKWWYRRSRRLPSVS